MSRLTKRSLTGIGIVALVVLVYGSVSRALLLSQTGTLLDEIRNLDKAQNPTAASLSFMSRRHSHFTGKTGGSDDCQYRFLFTNRLLSIPHFATRSEIEVLFTIWHDRLSDVVVDFTSYVFRENSPVVHVQEGFGKGEEHFYLNPHGRDVPQTWNGMVQTGQFAKEEQRRAAWAFTTDCFVAVRGCRDISELLPSVWKRTSPGRVSSRMRSDSDSIADAAQPLPD